MRLPVSWIVVSLLGLAASTAQCATNFCDPKIAIITTNGTAGDPGCVQRFGSAPHAVAGTSATAISVSGVRDLSLLADGSVFTMPDRSSLTLHVCGLVDLFPTNLQEPAWVTVAELSFAVPAENFPAPVKNEGRILQLSLAPVVGSQSHFLLLADWYRTLSPRWSVYDSKDVPMEHLMSSVIGKLDSRCDLLSQTPILVQSAALAGIGVGIVNDDDDAFISDEMVWSNSFMTGWDLTQLLPYRIRAGVLQASYVLPDAQLRLAWDGVTP